MRPPSTARLMREWLAGDDMGVLAARYDDRIPASRNACRWVEERIRRAVLRLEEQAPSEQRGRR